MELADFIKVYNVGGDICDRILDGKVEGSEWAPHCWNDYGKGEFHSHDEKELDVLFLEPGDPSLEHAAQVIRTLVQAYALQFPEVGVSQFSDARLNRYTPNTVMRRHVDHIHTLFDGEAKGIPVLTILMNLNDGYEGGGLVVCDREYAMKKGDVILFPSCFLYPHEVLEVTAGMRFSAVSWAW
ncbi:MAG: 2OG-Fe(II) oxygenase [Planctomycetes bacterium]|nr:2OG-Fe(II) oxygenase [Planctomycetota bacterium]